MIRNAVELVKGVRREATISALPGTVPVIYGDGLRSRDFTYVDDAVRANLLAASAASYARTPSPGSVRAVTEKAAR